MRNILRLSVVLLAFVPCHAHAQWLFKKAAPRVPAQRVPELIQILRSDADERKRSAAADELRDYDVKAFPQIVPSLVEAALRDSKHGVRSDALSALSRIRPVSPMVGQTLEYAAANDSHWPNRVQAKSALMRYQWAGYTPGSSDKNPPTTPTTKEPAVAAKQQPGELPPIVNAAPMQNPAAAIVSPVPMPNIPSPQFPASQPSYPAYPTQNPLAIAPTMKVPAVSQPFANPLASNPVNTQPFPQTAMPQPTPNLVVPQPLNNPQPVAIPSVPIVAVPMPMPEPNLQFRPALNDPAPTAIAPQREIPLIDLNPVLTNTPTRSTPAAPLPNINNINPPVIVIPPADGGLPVPLPPANTAPLPTPLPKI